MKKCNECNKFKPLNEFPNRKHIKKDGSVSVYKRHKCRVCTNKENTDRYHGNPNTTSAHRKAAFKYSIKRYGITIEQYEDMLLKQDYRCAVCNTHQSETRFGKLCIDHDHSSGKVRELLCSNCNTALGHSKEDPSILNKLVAYLEKHNESCG